MGKASNKFISHVNKIEDGLLVAILSTMIILAIYQILARNIFTEGVVWIDPLLRTLVLWVGLSGAVVATRTDHHIRIDIFTKYMPEVVLPYVQRTVYIFTFSICMLIGWHAARFVYSEYEYGTIAFSGVPAWITASIIPVCFVLMALRYFFLFLSPYERSAEANEQSDSGAVE